MRFKSIPVCCALFILIADCTKKVDEGTLQGRWELTREYSGWGNHIDFAPGNGNTFQFIDDKFIHTIKRIDTTYQLEGNFSVYKGKACDGASAENLIQLDGVILSLYYTGYTFTIGISRECATDAGAQTFKRIFP